MSKSKAVAKVPRTQDMIDQLNDQIKQIKENTDRTPKTNGKMKTASNGEFDLFTATDPDKIVAGYGSILARDGQYKAAYDSLGIDTHRVIKVDGFTIDEWKEDVKTRLAIVSQEEKMKTLTTLKDKWTALMDKEDQKLALVKEMEKLTGISLPSGDDDTEDVSAEIS